MFRGLGTCLSASDTKITHTNIIKRKRAAASGVLEWTGMRPFKSSRGGVLYVYCPGHDGVSRNEHRDRLASTASIATCPQLGRAEVVRDSNKDRPKHHNIDHLKDRGVEKGNGRRSTLRGRERSEVNQTKLCIASKTALGRLLISTMERL